MLSQDIARTTGNVPDAAAGFDASLGGAQYRRSQANSKTGQAERASKPAFLVPKRGFQMIEPADKAQTPY